MEIQQNQQVLNSAVTARKNSHFLLYGLIVTLPAFLQSVKAQQINITDNVVRIGVLADMSGITADTGGRGSVVAAKMAVADFGGKVLGMPIEVVQADHLMKPDTAGARARQWFDQGVDAIFDLPLSAAALAAVEVGRQKQKMTFISGAASSDLTGKWCSPYSVHWSEDTYALANGVGNALVNAGSNSWYFLAADVAFGQALQRDATAAIEAKGGKVVGSVRHPLGASDFSSFLLSAQASKAKVIGLASAGADTINVIKQASEFSITKSGQKLAVFLMFISDVHALGLDKAQGLNLVEGFYWNQNKASRDFSQAFFKQTGRMPTKQQAGVYGSVIHYLKAVQVAKTDAGDAVAQAVRNQPLDFFGRKGSVRKDGRAVYDLSLYRVKSPAESKSPWDYYDEVGKIPAASAFADPKTNGCPLNAGS